LFRASHFLGALCETLHGLALWRLLQELEGTHALYERAPLARTLTMDQGNPATFNTHERLQAALGRTEEPTPRESLISLAVLTDPAAMEESSVV
jgi:hypothetical protein